MMILLLLERHDGYCFVFVLVLMKRSPVLVFYLLEILISVVCCCLPYGCYSLTSFNPSSFSSYLDFLFLNISFTLYFITLFLPLSLLLLFFVILFLLSVYHYWSVLMILLDLIWFMVLFHIICNNMIFVDQSVLLQTVGFERYNQHVT